MPYTLRHEAQNECVVLTVTGTVTMEAIREMAPAVAALCERTGCRRILNDMSTATVEVSFLEVFGSPKAMDESGVSRQTIRALVVPPDFREAGFLETVTRNRGHNLRVFTDLAEAKRWLLAGP